MTIFMLLADTDLEQIDIRDLEFSLSHDAESLHEKLYSCFLLILLVDYTTINALYLSDLRQQLPRKET
jgi:hypothetical protein